MSKKIIFTLLGLVMIMIFALAGCDNAGAGGSSGGGGDDPNDPAQYGTLVGAVRDAVTGDDLSGVTVEVLDSTGNVETTVTTDSSGEFSVDVVAEQGKQVFFEKSGYLSVTFSNINVVANMAAYLETLLQIDEAYDGTGDASGTITDAFTGHALNDVDVGLRDGVNTYAGSFVSQTTTNSSGAFFFAGLDAGHYTAEISKNGYTTAHFTLFVLGGESSTDNNYSMTPNIASDEIRIILDWGANPSDLDSHTTGPLDGSSDRFHVYYSSMGDDEASPYTELDIDDVTSYGPETTTIYEQFSGDYYFYVHDFTNRGSTSSTALGDSGARVRLYIGSTLITTFNVPSQEGTLWKVFKLNGTTVTPINQMMYESSPSGVSARSLSFTEDESSLFRNLPRK